MALYTKTLTSAPFTSQVSGDTYVYTNELVANISISGSDVVFKKYVPDSGVMLFEIGKLPASDLFNGKLFEAILTDTATTLRVVIRFRFDATGKIIEHYSTDPAFQTSLYSPTQIFVYPSEVKSVRFVSQGSGQTVNATIQEINLAPTTPTLTSPSNNQTIKQSTDITFQWSASSDPDGDALTYTLQVGTSAGASNIYNASVGSATSKKGISTSWAVGLYYWRVIANDGKGGVTTSAEGTFGIAQGNLVTLTQNNSIMRDAGIASGVPTQNLGSATTVAIGQGSSGVYRLLMFFDFGLIPNNAIINSATLFMRQNAVNGAASQVDIHPITVDWTETGATWANSNANYDASKKVSSTPPMTANIDTNFDVKTLVQDMVNGEYPNFGFMIKQGDEIKPSINRTFCTKENETVAYRPTLTIDYSIPTTGKKQVEYIGNGGAISATNATSFTIPLPTSQTGDALIAQLRYYSTETVTIPSGWSILTNTLVGGTTRHIFLYKIKTSNEPNLTLTTTQPYYWSGVIHVLRNVKGYKTATIGAFTSGGSAYPPATSTTVDKTLFMLLNNNEMDNAFTPPLSYNEVLDQSANGQHQAAVKYMYTDKDQTTAEMTSTTAVMKGLSVALVLEPIVNNLPTLTLTSPSNNQTLSEGNTMAVQGAASDVDSGNVVTAKYKINNGPVRALQSGVSNGSTPISFAKNLTYKGKRLWDGNTDVIGADLAENTDHTLTVWAEDDQGGKSTEVTRKFKVIWNRPPVIDGQNKDLGTMEVPPVEKYTITEPESNPFTVTEKINGVVIRTFPGVAGRQETITIPHDKWLLLEPGVLHRLTIEATDDQGMMSTREFTLTRFVDKIIWMMDFETMESATKEFFTTDVAAKRLLLTPVWNLPPGANLLVEVCNNAYDAAPTWEDATIVVKLNRAHLFANTTKTAAKWGINFRFRIEKGTANLPVYFKGIGGAFD